MYGACDVVQSCTVAIFMYHIAGNLVGKKVGEFESTLFEHWQKKVWWINRSTKRLLIASTNLDGSSLANHGKFVKFSKFSPNQTFPLYGI